MNQNQKIVWGGVAVILILVSILLGGSILRLSSQDSEILIKDGVRESSIPYPFIDIDEKLHVSSHIHNQVIQDIESEKLVIKKNLTSIDLCGKIYKRKQVLVDGIDVIQKAMPFIENDPFWKKRFCSSLESSSGRVGGVIEQGEEIHITLLEKNPEGYMVYLSTGKGLKHIGGFSYVPGANIPVNLTIDQYISPYPYTDIDERLHIYSFAYNEILNNIESGELTINRELEIIELCGKTYKTKQILISGVNIIQETISLLKKGEGLKKEEWFCSLLQDRAIDTGGLINEGQEIHIVVDKEGDQQYLIGISLGKGLVNFNSGLPHGYIGGIGIVVDVKKNKIYVMHSEISNLK